MNFPLIDSPTHCQGTVLVTGLTTGVAAGAAAISLAENAGVHQKNPGSEQQKMRSSSRIMGFHGQEWIRLRSLVARNYFEPPNW